MRRSPGRFGPLVRRLPPRRRFLIALFVAVVGVVLLVGAVLLAIGYLTRRDVLFRGQSDPYPQILAWGLLVSVALAVPLRYLLGGRSLADGYADAQDQATLDGLTGLRNHWAFREMLRHEIARTQRFGGSFTLALIDVDDFKFVNDSLGHQRGDEILVALSQALSSGRSVDRAFRVGGDEFALVMTHTGLDGAVHAIDRLKRVALEQMGGTTISVGLAEFDPISIDTDARTDSTVLRDRADRALYEAKRRGRNEVITFREIAESAPMRTSAATIIAVRRLLATRRMGAAFQPIWNLDTHRVFGYEGLARPAVEYRLGSPEDAFSGAARLGRVDELDALCRSAVLSHVQDFPCDALLFLNLAPEVLEHGVDAGVRLQQEVEAAGLRPSRVVLELTEYASERMGLVFAPVQMLRDLGFRLALDDVGSADVGLGLLGRIRPDYVKVDRAVVCSARDGGSGRAVLAAIVAYAAESGAIVIAEGIETEEILNHLVSAARTISRRARFVGGQGYLLGRPEADPWGDPERTWPLASMV
ncbi:bifunctional diguanylate cyclase/phosphodiesterase [Pengzhenrongella frigida]|uniref:Bifunctional diguanylate cyclase/phosphodiesterase n=1 Tax=Pengzhenrongella frigida TaxID=1259133 RepID=A0A4Q5N0V3_9MICO|nr:bifunctional diguanylate cyclase/phosphodiesterase [Cellulomonas sp. HLT2-17]RYV51675.1 bifunctional diguanylate cyclase/phosphodiesterase [Cellulomonas sp. HLT2-17]